MATLETETSSPKFLVTLEILKFYKPIHVYKIWKQEDGSYDDRYKNIFSTGLEKNGAITTIKFATTPVDTYIYTLSYLKKIYKQLRTYDTEAAAGALIEAISSNIDLGVNYFPEEFGNKSIPLRIPLRWN